MARQENAPYVEKMKEIVSSKQVSLRMVDYFVVTYSRKNHVWWLLHGEPFEAHRQYQMRLRAMGKHAFDPFCRNKSGQNEIVLPDGFETTRGQMNFFHWAFEARVLQYVETHYDLISADMNTTFGERERRNSSAGRLKKQPLCDEAQMPCQQGAAASVRLSNISTISSTSELYSALPNVFSEDNYYGGII